MSICERIKELCNERGLSMYRVERDCGFGNGSIMKWENSSPKVENIIKLADYFEVSVDYLLGRERVAEENAILADKIDFDISTNYGADYLEKIYKELDEKQKVFVISWLVGYAKSQGIPVKF